MRRILVLMSAIALLLIAVVPAAAAGSDAECTDFPLESPPYRSPFHLVEGEVIDGNLVVPPGPDCVIFESTVNGDVTVEQGGAFTEIVASTIGGNVELGKNTDGILAASEVHGNVLIGKGAFSALLFGVRVSGDLSCDECSGVDMVFGSTVEGNVQIAGEKDGSWFVDSTIGGNLQIEDSRVSEIAFWAQGMTVEGNLEIKNSKGPIYLFDNNVEGNVSIVDNKLKQSELFPGPTPVWVNPWSGEKEPLFPWDVRDTTNKGEIIGNTVGGNLEFKDNRGGRALIAENAIEGNLTCDGNKKRPEGSGNTADQLEGQCKNL